jgi:hypothetical protein
MREPLFIATTETCKAVDAFIKSYSGANNLGNLSYIQLRRLIGDAFSIAGVYVSFVDISEVS